MTLPSYWLLRQIFRLGSPRPRDHRVRLPPHVHQGENRHPRKEVNVLFWNDLAYHSLNFIDIYYIDGPHIDPAYNSYASSTMMLLKSKYKLRIVQGSSFANIQLILHFTVGYLSMECVPLFFTVQWLNNCRINFRQTLCRDLSKTCKVDEEHPESKSNASRCQNKNNRMVKCWPEKPFWPKSSTLTKMSI